MRKAFLVPSDITQTVKPVDETLNALDSEMLYTIQNKVDPMDIKMIKYNQILQRYKFLETERNKPYTIEVEQNTTLNKLSEHIFEGMPKKQLPLAKLLKYRPSHEKNQSLE